MIKRCFVLGMTTLLLDNGSIQKHDKIGWMPLHFAVKLGYVEIAKMLLIKDRSTAYKADNKGRTALHVAARHGRVNIMRELISICPSCCELVDKKGRNVLHHASKSKNRNAVRLVLRKPSLGNLINEKDKNGNTPFLLSASLHSIINHPKVDRLVFNNHNESAVEVSLANRALWRCDEITRLFLIMGEISRGRRLMSNDKYGEGKENKSNSAVSSKSKDGNGNGNENDRSTRNDSVIKARQNELLAATLIATVTFAAGFTVPGGFISEKGPDQGDAILLKSKAFKAFVILNSMSMILSSLAVMTYLRPRYPYLDTHMTVSRKMRFGGFLLDYAMWAMIGAFLSGTCAVLYRDKILAISACVVPVAMIQYVRIVNKIEPLFYMSLRLTNRKSFYNLICVVDELWYEISQGGFKNLIRNKLGSDFEDVLVLGTTTLLLNDKRILKSKQDQQGWTPLHLAAHLGYIVILKMLLIKDRSAAYKADNEGKTALHVAAGLGRVGIMRELISRCPGCCELVDKRGWNVLHFASTSKNRMAVGLILRNPLLGNLVNEKDEKGNTPFLHAASMRFIINHSKVDEKVFNNENQNAEDMIDLLTIFPWNSRLDIILWLFGTSSRIIRNGRLFLSKDDDKEGKENRVDSVSSNEDGVGKNYLVVATLIATVTFAAGFTVPGGFVANEGPTQGAAILTKNRAFQAFVLFNTVSMFLSSLAVFNHLSIRPATHKIEIYRRMSFRDLLIRYAMLAMIGAFLAGTCAVLHNDQKLAINACVVPVAVYLFVKRITKSSLHQSM
ncbi:hypothetical protein EZV62_002871 [Acer yangbiense]|uniref:PGG domain-containing protein n=1 Tax=Acer yangbiense TaxID=1000413 RepID=A0A5C7J0D3_9ROSI|nr:hypothetical protein EZV62_002871 [Acer yangbiense]